MSWGCCAPATGTTTSRAKKERATKYDRRLIDTTSLCATSFSRNPGSGIATNMTMTPDRAAVNACNQTLIKLLESLERVFLGRRGGRSFVATMCLIIEFVFGSAVGTFVIHTVV